MESIRLPAMIRELRTFLAVARHGTFSRAGEQVALSQSAVSAQIQRLEGTLGFALFDRIGRNARLNAAGRETLARAEVLISQFEALLQPHAAAPAAALRIGAIASVQGVLMPDVLVQLRGQHPGLRLRVVPGVSMDLLGQVDDGRLDAAVLIRPPFEPPRELAWRPLWTEPFVLVVPATLRGNDWAKHLRSQPFLRYDRSSFGGRQVTRFLEANGIEVDDSIEMDDIGALVQLVLRGAGVALLPRCRPYFPLPPSARAITLGAAAPRRDIGLIERARHPHAALVDALHHALKRRARQAAER
jgi:DNA-binding transcriptional LysR family regulator